MRQPARRARRSPDLAAALAYDRWFERPWGRYAFTVEAAAVDRAAGAGAGALVLDAGCGTGRFSTRLADNGAIAIGVDLDPAMLAVAQPRLPGRCARASVGALPFRDGAFHLTVAVTVLEFVDDPAGAVAELVRVTRPGGRVVIAALNPRSPWGWANRRRLRSGAWCGATFLGAEELRALAAPHGHARLQAALYAPGAVPGLAVVGPVLEAIGRVVPRLGAFQTVVITTDGGTSA